MFGKLAYYGLEGMSAILNLNPADARDRFSSLAMTSVIGSQPSLLVFRFISATPPGWLGGQLTPPQCTNLTYTFTAYSTTTHINFSNIHSQSAFN